MMPSTKEKIVKPKREDLENEEYDPKRKRRKLKYRFKRKEAT